MLVPRLERRGIKVAEPDPLGRSPSQVGGLGPGHHRSGQHDREPAVSAPPQGSAGGLQGVAKPHHVELLDLSHADQHRPAAGQCVEVMDRRQLHELATEFAILQHLLDGSLQLLIEGHGFLWDLRLTFEDRQDQCVRFRLFSSRLYQSCLHSFSSPPAKGSRILRAAWRASEVRRGRPVEALLHHYRVAAGCRKPASVLPASSSASGSSMWGMLKIRPSRPASSNFCASSAT